MPVPFADEVRVLLARLDAGPSEAAMFEELMLRAAALAPSSQTTVTLDTGPQGMRAPAPEAPRARRRHTGLSTSGERYHDLEALGAGGMGEVFRVHDRQLNRTVARKVLRATLSERAEIVERFVQEAQTTAQLQHPAIVPVHELGQHDDGRLWFTMKEVKGDTLTLKIRTLHAASRRGRWSAAGDGTTLRQLVSVFHEACQAMAYAHHRGVIHRDLKPDNIMVGRYGEVFVMDWGIAKVLDPGVDEPMTLTPRKQTREGRVTGTPAYMCPEQAWAQPSLTPQADVYSLGAILYEILAGRPPYQGEPRDIVRMLRNGTPVQPPGSGAPAAWAFTETRDFSTTTTPLDHDPERPPPAPPELVQICMTALSYDPAERQADAMVLAAQVEAWLTGAERASHALQLVEQAQALEPEADGLRARADQLRSDSRAALAALPAHTPSPTKEPLWAQADEADALDREADLLRLDQEGLLRGALAQSPGLPEAHAALARFHHRAHREAEARGQRREAALSEVRLAAHLRALPDDDPLRVELSAYLDGGGTLTLTAEVPGTARIARLHTEGRRRVAEHDRTVPLPLQGEPLPMGAWLVSIDAPGRATVEVPVVVGRQGAWPPEPWSQRTRVTLPREEELGHDDVFVPAGPYHDGDRLQWVDDLVVRRHPVTLRDYLAFLDDLLAQGREADALQCMPQEQHGGVAGVALTGEGRFTLLPDPDGDLWNIDWPVIMVDWASARAYAAWEAERTGQPWRLPWEREWLKVARGAEGRRFPWGDEGDPTWLCGAHARAEGPSPAEMHSFPHDTSVQGVRHLAGNVLEWCLDAAEPAGGVGSLPSDIEPAELRALRGGSWTRRLDRCDTLQRTVLRADARMPDVGFRLVRSLFPPPEGS
jgi:serine/threonine-protein kinase